MGTSEGKICCGLGKRALAYYELREEKWTELEGDEDEEISRISVMLGFATNPVSLPECTSEECRTGQGTDSEHRRTCS